MVDQPGKKPPRSVKIKLSKEIYEKEAVLAAAYALTGVARDRVEPEPPGYVTVTLELLDSHRDMDPRELETRFMNEIIDQQLRLELERRYGALRQLIVKQAFSPLDNLKAEVKRIVGRS